jgi:hypothetical protein
MPRMRGAVARLRVEMPIRETRSAPIGVRKCTESLTSNAGSRADRDMLPNERGIPLPFFGGSNGNFETQHGIVRKVAPNSPPGWRRIELRLSNTHMAYYAGCLGFGLADPAIGALPHYRLPIPAQAESEDRT